MRRVALLSTIFALVISLAAPPGAAFALSEDVSENTVAEQTYIENAGLAVNSEAELPAREELMGPENTAIEEMNLENEADDLEIHAVPAATQVDGDAINEEEVPVVAYPRIFLSEIQVNGSCDGQSWCTGSNVEFIELHNPNDFAVSLQGWEIQRQATGETSQPVSHVKFGDIGLFAGEYAVVSLGLTQPADAIIASYTSPLNNTEGSLLLVAPDASVVDIVGWGAKSKSYYGSPAKAPKANQSVQRCLKDGTIFETSPRSNELELLVYEDLGPTPGVGIECAQPPVVNYCSGLVLSEIAANVSEQFIELHNPTGNQILAAGCKVQTNRNSNTFIFPEETVIESNAFVVLDIAATDLTLTKTTSGSVYLLSSDGENEVGSVTYSNLQKDTSWSLVEGGWVQTYSITPGGLNVYIQYPACEDGYWRNLETGRCNRTVELATAVDCGEGRERNPETGRCRNIVVASLPAPCKEGQYRSEETNRCRSIAIAAAAVLKPCAEGQFRNPETNRCKKIASSDDIALADCGEGRERNPATNRCRNVVTVGTLTDTLPFPVEPTEAGAEYFAGWWLVGAVTAIGTAYGIWEWRDEITGLTSRVLGKLKK